ncbi:hypothetical protein [Erythrobacter phage vB_EliS-L02]|nr:hypothetical protein [Erythrobacter phage vB_EliS-L02]
MTMSLTTPKARRSDTRWHLAITQNAAIAKSHGIDGAIQIYKGRYFWPLEPDHPGNDIDIETIAHATAVLPRWGGQTADEDGEPLRYSIAQHQVHTSEIAERSYLDIVPKWDWTGSASPALFGLIHDAAEGYGFADVCRPVKKQLKGYSAKEKAMLDRICQVLNIPVDMAITECIRRIDNMLVFLERDALMGPPVIPYSNENDHPRIDIRDVIPDFRVWSAAEAKERYIARYEELVA